MTGKLPEGLKRDMDRLERLAWANSCVLPAEGVWWSWYLTYLLRLESLARQIPRPE